MIKSIHILFNLFLIAISSTVCAQSEIRYHIAGPNIYASIPTNLKSYNLDSTLKSFGFNGPFAIDSMHSESGWKFYSQTKDTITLILNKENNTAELPHAFVIESDENQKITRTPFAYYGVNKFKNEWVSQTANETKFFLEGYEKAESVYLSGTFNDWSTNTPMTKSAKGWEVSLSLRPGKCLYKYIVDGRWIRDKNNQLKEFEGVGLNSVYFVYNYCFKLKGYPNAKKVEFAGSFCQWQRLKMEYNATEQVWFIRMYLREGTHAYKYVVDGQWINDPENPVTRPDGNGNTNSFISLGDTFQFKLNGYLDAKQVFLAGNFNSWNFSELQMLQIEDAWYVPYVLAPGNYEYKFKVNDTYIIDPKNPVTNGDLEYKNSVMSVNPNITFKLRTFSEAKEVLLSGSFNDWSNSGYSMKKLNNEWVLPLHLDKGKYTYKFIVDGVWITDPENKHWEYNEHHSRNSVLWVVDETKSAE